jgi:hypothetical protein
VAALNSPFILLKIYVLISMKHMPYMQVQKRPRDRGRESGMQKIKRRFRNADGKHGSLKNRQRPLQLPIAQYVIHLVLDNPDSPSCKTEHLQEVMCS